MSDTGTAEYLHELILRHHTDKVIGLAGSLTKDQQMYLLAQVLRLSSEIKGIGYRAQEGWKMVEKGPWFSCGCCDQKWLDLYNPPPEENDGCGHSEPR